MEYSMKLYVSRQIRFEQNARQAAGMRGSLMASAHFSARISPSSKPPNKQTASLALDLCSLKLLSSIQGA
jgi:hypothetical protein